jgi:Glutamine amidotransferase domain
VVNGEFYDFERIRVDLEARGHEFRTRSDSEIVLHLYEEFGVDCLQYLRGEYSFVLWDERNKTLFAALYPRSIRADPQNLAHVAAKRARWLVNEMTHSAHRFHSMRSPTKEIRAPLEFGLDIAGLACPACGSAQALRTE